MRRSRRRLAQVSERRRPPGGGGRSLVARGFRLAAFTAVAAFVVTFPAQAAADTLGWAALPILVAIVALGVTSDMIGVAATRADETPFVARAAKRRPGAREGLDLVRHADLVATVASDVVGDLSGTISGAMLASVVLRVTAGAGLPAPLRTAIGVAVLTGATIGVKAWTKAYAVRHADDLVQLAGAAVALGKRLTGRPPGRRP
jgi:hypothetical protein